MVDQIERYVHSQIQCHWVDFVDHNVQSLEVDLCEVEWPLAQDNPSHNMQAYPYENNVYLSKLKANFSPIKFTFLP